MLQGATEGVPAGVRSSVYESRRPGLPGTGPHFDSVWQSCGRVQELQGSAVPARGSLLKETSALVSCCPALPGAVISTAPGKGLLWSQARRQVCWEADFLWN